MSVHHHAVVPSKQNKCVCVEMQKQTDVDRFGAEETVDGDGVVLADAVAAVLGLLVVLRVERHVVEDHRRRARQVEAQPCGLGR